MVKPQRWCAAGSLEINTQSRGQAPVPYSPGSWRRKQKGFPCDLTKTWVPTNHPCDAVENALPNASQTQTLPGTGDICCACHRNNQAHSSLVAWPVANRFFLRVILRPGGRVSLSRFVSTSFIMGLPSTGPIPIHGQRRFWKVQVCTIRTVMKDSPSPLWCYVGQTGNPPSLEQGRLALSKLWEVGFKSRGVHSPEEPPMLDIGCPVGERLAEKCFKMGIVYRYVYNQLLSDFVSGSPSLPHC